MELNGSDQSMMRFELAMMSLTRDSITFISLVNVLDIWIG
jgi:hypothetical protein